MTAPTLMLRTCRPDGHSFNGFKWPLEVGARVEAPDWNPEPVCGGGLHGLIGGQGDGTLLDWSPDAVWLAFDAEGEVVDLGGKGKCRAGVVRAVGDRLSITGYMMAHGCTAVVGGTATAWDWGTATAGYRGTVEIMHWDGKRRRRVVGYVGENGIEAGVAYRVSDDGTRLVPAKQEGK